MKAAAIIAAILAALLAISGSAQEFGAKRSASEVYRFRGAHPCPAVGDAVGYQDRLAYFNKASSLLA